jgi:hypothetical protein
MRRGATFRRLLGDLQEECGKLGLDVSTATMEDVLEARIQDVSAALRIQTATVLSRYAETVDVVGLAAVMAEADRQGRAEVEATPHAIMDRADLGRIVASLGQVVRYVSLNNDDLNGGPGRRWSAIGVLDNAGNGLTALGAALTLNAVPGGATILVPDEAIVYARRALTETIDNITSRRWTYDKDNADLDDQVVERMRDDLALLPGA